MTSSVSGTFIRTPLLSQCLQHMDQPLQVKYDLQEDREEVEPGFSLPNEHSHGGKANGNYKNILDIALQLENACETDRLMMENLLMKDAEITNGIKLTSLLNYTLAMRRKAALEELGLLPKDDQVAILECKRFLQMDKADDCVDGFPSNSSLSHVESMISQEANLCAKTNAAELKKCLLNLFSNTSQQSTEEDEVDGAFDNLRRFGKLGKLVMHAVDKSGDLVPTGNCCLIDLAQQLKIDDGIHQPEYATAIVRWDSKTKKVVFPEDFQGVIPRVIATNDNLQYYGCCFACQSMKQIQMLFPSEIQTFAYSPDYLSNYVMPEEKDGGASLERHPFPHLDSPLCTKSGVLVLGKFTDDTETQLHLTAFYVPRGQIVYIPGNVIHTNNYFHGNWKTLLSDGADVDLVHLVKDDKLGTKFRFTFTELNID